MRKFQKRGKISRKKMMRKVASGEQRQVRLCVSFSHMSVPLMLRDCTEKIC
jgi:ribosomal protein L18